MTSFPARTSLTAHNPRSQPRTSDESVAHVFVVITTPNTIFHACCIYGERTAGDCDGNGGGHFEVALKYYNNNSEIGKSRTQKRDRRRWTWREFRAEMDGGGQKSAATASTKYIIDGKFGYRLLWLLLFIILYYYYYLKKPHNLFCLIAITRT